MSWARALPPVAAAPVLRSGAGSSLWPLPVRQSARAARRGPEIAMPDLRVAGCRCVVIATSGGAA